MEKIFYQATRSGLRGKTFFFFFFFLLLRAAPKAYGNSQARGQIGATTAGLHHSHSNAGSELYLQPMLQLTAMWILNPVSKATDQTCILMDPSHVHYC